MKNRKKIYYPIYFCLIILSVLCIEQTYGALAAKNEVHTVARNFIALQSNRLGISTCSVSSMDTLKEEETKRILGYIIHLQPAGYIILAPDKRLQPIIAYSFMYNWPKQNCILNELVRRDLSTRITLLKEQTSINEKWNIYGTTAPDVYFQQWPAPGTTPTGGWIETVWHQGDPYNRFCPKFPDTEKRCPVGCVALALAQLLNYHHTLGDLILNDEDKDIAIRYELINYNQVEQEYSLLPFNEINDYLTQIKSRFNTDEALSTDQISALCLISGMITSTSYDRNGSGATLGSIPNLLADRMGFQSVEQKEPDDMTYAILKENMLGGYPVLLSILNSVMGGGHAVIADGFNTDGFFHINFGWGALSPDSVLSTWYFLPRMEVRDYSFITNIIYNIKPVIDKPDLAISDTIINLGGARIGAATETHPFELTNVSMIPLQIYYVKTTAHFILEQNNAVMDSLHAFELLPASVLQLNIKCQPDSFGIFKGSLVVSYGKGTQFRTIDLRGYGIKDRGTIINETSEYALWEKQNSPYYICSDITVEDGETLTIEPGVDIIFMDHLQIRVNPESRLIARGAEEDSIFFGPADTSIGWAGISFNYSNKDDTLSYCRINGIKNILKGGSVSLHGSSPFIEHSVFNNNTALAGGALYLDNSAAVIKFCHFYNNYAQRGHGGALYIRGRERFHGDNSVQRPRRNQIPGISPKIFNSLFHNNVAAYGGAIFCSDTAPHFLNVTIADNVAVYLGGGIRCSDDDHIYIENCILWGNTARAHAGDNYFINSPRDTIEFKFSNVDQRDISQYLVAERAVVDKGISNFSKDPEFDSQYHLSPASPCIDRGNPESGTGDEPFPHGFRINMGAYGGTKSATKTLNSNLTILPDQLDFDNITAGETKYLTVHVKNGSAAANGLNQISCEDSSHFFPTRNAIGQISSGTIDSFKVGFKTMDSKIARFQSNLSILFNNGDSKQIPIIGSVGLGSLLQGNISGQLIKNNNPYYVSNTLTIETNDTLRIEPGVQINFIGGNGFHIKANATLLATGTDEEPIIFNFEESDSPKYGFFFELSQKNNLLKYCLINEGNFIFEPISLLHSVLTIDHCTVSNNKTYRCGVIYANYSDCTISYCRIFNNCTYKSSFYNSSFGIFSSSSDFRIKNTLMYNNENARGFFRMDRSRFELNNISLVENDSVGMDLYGGNNIHIINSILWENKIIDNSYSTFGDSLTVDYSCIGPDFTEFDSDKIILNVGNGMVYQDPLFYHGNEYKFRLSDNSPCLDAGNPDKLYDDVYDPANPGQALAPAGGTLRNDMGAYGGGGHERASSDPDYYPKQFILGQNYPNPFNTSTIIPFQIPTRSPVKIEIYNLLGQHIATLLDKTVDPGSYKIHWNIRNDNQHETASGIYFCILRNGGNYKIKKMLLVR